MALNVLKTLADNRKRDSRADGLVMLHIPDKVWSNEWMGPFGKEFDLAACHEDSLSVQTRMFEEFGVAA